MPEFADRHAYGGQLVEPSVFVCVISYLLSLTKLMTISVDFGMLVTSSAKTENHGEAFRLANIVQST